MANYIKVRGLARRGFRVGGQQITSGKVSVVDLDDGTSRRDFGHHASIGQLASLGATDAAVARAGAKVTPGATTTVDVSAGAVLVDKAVPGAAATSNAITATAGVVVAANATGAPRVDLVSVLKTGGAPVYTVGTAVPPALPANSVPLATVTVPSPLGASTSYTITDIAPRL